MEILKELFGQINWFTFRVGWYVKWGYVSPVPGYSYREWVNKRTGETKGESY